MVWHGGLTCRISSGEPGTASNRLRFIDMFARFETLSPVAMFVLIAAAGGLIGGGTAVLGLKQNRYGPQAPPALIGRAHAGSAPAYYASTDEYDADAAAGCDGCSERDLGYRWAAMKEVRFPEQCPHDSWGLRRGCLDYTGGL